MRRRTFLAGLTTAAAATSLGAQQGHPSPQPTVPAPGQGGAPTPTGAPLPDRWVEGEARFVRPDIGPGDRPIGASFASRTAVYGVSGAAGTAHPLATQAGIDMLRRGGSAVDAAIAINACLGFLEPTACGVGGDCYAMLWDPRRRWSASPDRARARAA